MIECAAMLFSAGGSHGVPRTADVAGTRRPCIAYAEKVFLPLSDTLQSWHQFICNVQLFLHCRMCSCRFNMVGGVGRVRGHLRTSQSDVKWSKEIKALTFQTNLAWWLCFFVIIRSWSWHIFLHLRLLSHSGSIWFLLGGSMLSSICDVEAVPTCIRWMHKRPSLDLYLITDPITIKP